MAGPYYFLDDETNTLDLDSTFFTVNLGTPRRRYSIIPFGGSNGGYINGTGLYESREIVITTRYTSTNINTWTSTRNNLFDWINKAKWEEVNFKIKFDDDSTIVKTRVYPSPANAEVYNFIRVSERVSFRFLCEKPYFENVTGTTGSQAIPDNSTQTVNIDNTGKYETSAKFKFTPTGNETLFQVELANNFGFTLGGSFNAGVQVVYDTGNNSLTIGGVAFNALQFLTSGGPFNMPVGAVDYFVTTSGPGSFAYEFNERYV